MQKQTHKQSFMGPKTTLYVVIGLAIVVLSVGVYLYGSGTLLKSSIIQILPSECISNMDTAECDEALKKQFHNANFGRSSNARFTYDDNKRIVQFWANDYNTGGISTLSNILSLQRLKDVQLINMSGLAGNIPPLGPRIEQLKISRSKLTGPLPPLPAALKTLFIEEGRLSGSLPAFNNGLEYIHLYENNISGNLPPFPATLKEVSIVKTQITGPLPPLPAKLQILTMYDNKLTGPLPSPLGGKSLQSLSLSSNMISGSLPDLSLHFQLKFLNLAENKFTGKIRNLPPNADSIYLSNNQLSGDYPSSISANKCDVRYNNLTGTPPDNYSCLWDPQNNTTSGPPSVSINEALGQEDPTNKQPVEFNVTFSEPVTEFGLDDIIVDYYTKDTGAKASLSGGIDGKNWTVSFSGMNKSGPIMFYILANSATDSDGNGNLEANILDNIVQYKFEVTGVTGGTANFTPDNAQEGDQYSFAVVAGPPNATGDIYKSDNGGDFVKTSSDWITLDSNGNATKGPWGCGVDSQTGHYYDVYIRWKPEVLNLQTNIARLTCNPRQQGTEATTGGNTVGSDEIKRQNPTNRTNMR